jgi:hypothetical protein
MGICLRCGVAFVASGRRRYCSDACKQADWRARHGGADPAPRAAVPPAAVVYECPECEQRYLGVRRCDDCGLFCRRLGPGGLCPHCDEPVAHADLDS